MSQLRSPKSIILQRLAWFFVILMINQIVFPAAALALTSGPSQPEVQSFQPVGATDMVNLFTGDFSYNVPLFEVPGPDGGYPVNLFYNSVTNTDKEASWTGLGWNINMGSLSRNMRGLPDDFDGEQVTRKLDMLKNETVVAGTTVGLEIGGYDAAGEAVKGLGASLSLSTNYTYNSYQGAGFSIDPMIGIKGSFGGDGGGNYKPRLSLGLNLSTNSIASLNTNFSMGVIGDKASNTFNFGLNFNGREGLSSLSLGHTWSSEDRKVLDESKVIGGKTINSVQNPAGGGTNASYSFAQTSYTPEVKIPWAGWNLSGSFSFAPGAAIVYGTFGFNGSYSVQYVKNGGRAIPSRAYGYNYIQNALDDNASMMDFNREKDVAVHRHNRFLATPSLSYDIYSVVGQGIGGMYRPHRSDYGFVYDQEMFANTGGGSIGGQVGPVLKVGVDVNVNYSEQRNSRWPKNNNFFGNKDEPYSFRTAKLGAEFENVYYKTAGDMASEGIDDYDYMGGEKPLRLKKNNSFTGPIALFQYDKTNQGTLETTVLVEDVNNNQLTEGQQAVINFNNGKSRKEKRRARNIAIQNISNNDLLDGNGEEMLPEYDIQYYNITNGSPVSQTAYSLAPSTSLNRTANEQNAGFTALGINGVRWVYGLPLINKEQKEAVFSVDTEDACKKNISVPSLYNGTEIDYKRAGTHKYIDEKTIPEYAHSYMLTSVLGSDYVDIDNVPGPSNGDVGYWMKTNYVKISDNYQWRAPFWGGSFMEGLENDKLDDRGSFLWGNREVYLPATIETKTHIAYFEISPREDARGAGAYVQNEGDALGQYSYKLDKIKLYSKKEIDINGMNNAIPLKTVHFEYDYSLCLGVENNGELNGGKLTLKKVWFTHEDSERGALSPYAFKYENNNHSYDGNAVDRWGAYKAVPPTDICANLHNPYTDQSPSNKNQLDADISSWHLSKIILPSGASMNIELERDDYAYVQDAVATQMQAVSGFGNNLENKLVKDADDDLNEDERKIYFQLETPLLLSEKNKLRKYIEDLPLVKRKDGEYKQLYYKIRSNLKGLGKNVYEYVTGYTEIEKKDNGQDMIDFDLNSEVNGKYTHAHITIMTARKQIKGKRYHPVLVSNWDFLKDRLPSKMFKIDQDPNPENAIPQFAGLGAGFAAIFTGYYTNAEENNFGTELNLNDCFIKLNTPDKVKYGGGARVKQIVMEDNWQPEADLTNTMGVVYDYSIENEEGEVYSSGVMENETPIGYDACALKYADITEEKQGGQTKDVHIYEYPMNESMHPGSGVGYSQVKVRSLASNYALEASKATNRAAFLAANNLPDGFGTTGETVHEFYTAKDFPIITDKTSLDDRETQPWLSMLSSFLIMSREDKYIGTQGYSIELNNMHGQSKSVKTYAQDELGNIVKQPLTQMSYVYNSKKKTVKDRGRFKTVEVLDNEVDVLISDNPNEIDDPSTTTVNELDAVTAKRLVGVDYDFFMDGRESTSLSTSGGIALNIDVLAVYPVPFPWPQFKLNRNVTRLAVTNKVVNRRGILTEVQAYDGQSYIRTFNKVFDKYTGQPLLTYTENQLGGGIYNYSVPAYMAYDNLGMAASNTGMKFTTMMTASNSSDVHEYTLNIPNSYPIEGDEYIVSGIVNNQEFKTRAICIGNNIFSVEDVVTATGVIFTFHNVRSGNKNLLSAPVAQYSTVKHEDDTGDNANPLKNRAAQSCTPSFVKIIDTPDNPAPDARAMVEMLNEIITKRDHDSYRYGIRPHIQMNATEEQHYRDHYSSSEEVLSPSYLFDKLTGPDRPILTILKNNGDCRIDVAAFPINNQQSGLRLHYPHVGSSPTPSYTSPYITTWDNLKELYNNIVYIDMSSLEELTTTPTHFTAFGNSISGNWVLFDAVMTSGYQFPQALETLNDYMVQGRIRLIMHLHKEEASSLKVKAEPSTGVQVDYKTINQVLAASATAYSDEWNVEHYDHCLNLNPWQNAYIKGEKGIWRAKGSYSYLEDRNFAIYNPNGISAVDVDIKNSGAVDNVALFNYNDPYFEYCDRNWVRTETVTKYNLAGAAIEAKDILGNHQAEIYGYKDNLVVAKGINTRYYEMGFEGFEEPNETGTIQDLAANGHYNNSNLNFLPFYDCDNSLIMRQENYHLSYPTKLEANGNTAYILINKPYDESDDLKLAGIRLNLTSKNNSVVDHLQIPASSSIDVHAVNIDAGDHFMIPGLAPALDETTRDEFTLLKLTLANGSDLGTSWWTGEATLYYDQDLSASNAVLPTGGKARISNEKAHTGDYSLQLVLAPNTASTFPQNTLHLQLNKEYIFSTWINTATIFGAGSEIKHTYDNGYLEIRMGGALMKPTGNIIEGWQRVEGKFTYSGDNDLVLLDSEASRVMYLDDVRIYPADANMQSYVYDPVNYKLRATLDNNNYATFYVYDDDGSLIITKKETEKGVKTIQESRSYVKRNGQ